MCKLYSPLNLKGMKKGWDGEVCGRDEIGDSATSMNSCMHVTVILVIQERDYIYEVG